MPGLLLLRAGALILFFASSAALTQTSPWAVLWTTPCILIASVMITWGAESAQFFVAQGFALAMLAWMQTLPEFAVEAVLAWKGQQQLLMANLTGALRLLTGLAWPLIYLTAAVVHRRATGTRMRSIQLDRHHSVEVVGLVFPMLYAFFIGWKGKLEIYDAGVLIALYVAYLALLSKLPPQEHEGFEDLDSIPRKIVLARPIRRNLAITACFLIGGAMVFTVAEPFLGSLVAVALAARIPTFVTIQWLAPIISEFPELLSTFYFARQRDKAAVGLMNIASSNINQWTLLVGMLPVVLSLGTAHASILVFDSQQRVEWFLTLGQSTVGLLFLVNMEFAWWEAGLMFLLFATQFLKPGENGEALKAWITGAFFTWSAFEVIRLLLRRRRPEALVSFSETWRSHIRAKSPTR